jgi:Uma2 family endonuclease
VQEEFIVIVQNRRASNWVPDPEYPDDDGIPVSDNTRQMNWIMLLMCNLELQFQKQDVFVAANLLWYPRRKLPGETQAPRLAPDVMVVFGRPRDHRGSYQQWRENNIGVHVVFEIDSPSNTESEMDDKFRFYDEYGIEEFYHIYPDRPCHVLGWHRVDGRLQPIDNIYDWQSPRLGIYYQNPRGDLKVYGENDEEFVIPSEQMGQAKKKLKQAEQQAAKERKLAANERRRAEKERQTKEKLAAKLRELGVDPDQIM